MYQVVQEMAQIFTEPDFYTVGTNFAKLHTILCQHIQNQIVNFQVYLTKKAEFTSACKIHVLKFNIMDLSNLKCKNN